MKKKWFCVILAMLFVGVASAQKLGSQLIKDALEKSDTAKVPEKKKYKDVITKEAVTAKGFIDIHKVKSNYYLEIPFKVMGKPMLLAGRIAEITRNTELIAGQMPKDPTPVEWSADDNNVYLLDITNPNVCDPSETIAVGFIRNNLKPVMKAFPIRAVNPDSTGVVIDVSKFFCGEEKYLSPFTTSTPIDVLFNIRRLKGTFKADMSAILSFKAFPRNISFKTRMTYVVDDKPFTAIMNASMILLPDKPMRPRLSDERLGIFSEAKNIYSENKDRMESVRYINRWRLTPRPEDLERYKRGEVVVPEKQIVYYLDNAFPEKWRPWLKAGIEDWQLAFEEIGFADAIVAKDFPDDPDFDPEDIRNSCIFYASVPTANAMGPSWVDPRTGEILQGSVYFYHNVLKLLHNWRFIQTATVDSRVRREVFDMEVMGPMLRYLIAHEIGHTLGLMHNMRGSYAYPVDSLRSPSFTEKYGTTASIMDYARNNYVAQPGDGVTQLLPPLLGLYDKYVIKWIYKPIFEADTPEEEKPILNSWILEKGDDPIYLYGEQEILNSIDPAASSESLGDDAVKASRYGINNLKIVMQNLVAWTSKDGESYKYTEEMYKELLKQFERYMDHVKKYLGGNFLKRPVHGDGKTAYEAVPKAKQQEALTFIINQLKDLPEWTLDKNVKRYLHPGNDQVYDYQANYVRMLVHGSQLGKIGYTAKGSDDPYTQEEYLDDLYRLVWDGTIHGRNLSWGEKKLEYVYLHTLLGAVDLYTPETSQNVSLPKMLTEETDAGCCGMTTSTDKLRFVMKNHPEWIEEMSLTSSTKESDLKINGRALYYAQLCKIKKLVDKRARSAKGDLKAHYKYLAFELNKAVGN